VSRIYEALKRAQKERKMQSESGDAENTERRHAQRVTLRVPVFVYGYGSGTEPFHEETTSLVVNSNGALLTLTNPVKFGQRLLLTNPANLREQECRVVYLGTKLEKRSEVGVAFPEPTPQFWPLPAGPHSSRGPVV
jgi:hypothetical protein